MNFLELVKNRYSCRAYKSLDVEKEKLDYIMECVRFAPSAVNKQPRRFHIVNVEDEKAKLQQDHRRNCEVIWHTQDVLGSLMTIDAKN